MSAQPDFQQRLKSIEGLVSEIEAAADPSLRTTVRELLELVMVLHGTGLDRMLEVVRAASDEGESTVQKLLRDDLVASLLILHGIHPVAFETRVAQAVEKARSRLRAHEGEVELVSIEEGAVRLRLHSNGHGCGSNPQALRELVENAVYQGAPDITSLVIEEAGAKQNFVPLAMLQGAI
jgi:Fe-S cluster biogenesis protein NfuA